MIKVGIAGFGKIGRLRADIINTREDTILTGVFDVVKPKNQFRVLSMKHMMS